VRRYGRIGGDRNTLAGAVRRRESAHGKGLVFVYEAGPCGYGIYRLLRERGQECWVVAPSITPRRIF
jgi:transposase